MSAPQILTLHHILAGTNPPTATLNRANIFPLILYTQYVHYKHLLLHPTVL